MNMDSSFIITEGKRIGKLKWLKKTQHCLARFYKVTARDCCASLLKMEIIYLKRMVRSRFLKYLFESSWFIFVTYLLHVMLTSTSVTIQIKSC